jgi:hypothetical protein
VCRDYSSHDRSGFTSTLLCAVTTRHPAARALRQPRRAPRLLAFGLSGSTFRRLVALDLVVCLITASRSATTHRPDCTGSTTPMSCIRMRRLDARLLVGRSHWLSSCVRSLRLAARLLVIRIASALLRLCCASVRAVSTLNFSSVGRAGSFRVPGHSVVRRDYLSRNRNGYIWPTPRVRVPRHVAWLVTRLVAPLVVDYSASHRLVVDYFASAAHPGASARRAAHHMARCAARRQLLQLAQAHRGLLRLRRASRCLGTSRGSSRGSRSSSTTPPRVGSSSTTSPPPCV